MPVDLEEYLSDKYTDTSFTSCNYRKMKTPPTQPRPRPYTEEGTYRVIADHNEDIDMSSYFLDPDSEDDWVEVKDIK